MSSSRLPGIYRMQGLLALRQRTLEQRRQELALALARACEASGSAEAARRQVEVRRGLLDGAWGAEGARAADRVRSERYAARVRDELTALHAELRRCEDERARCEAEVAEKGAAVRAAEAALKAVEGHKEQWARARRREQLEREADEASDQEASRRASAGRDDDEDRSPFGDRLN